MDNATKDPSGNIVQRRDATVVIIGKTGTGKSTLCNAFLLGDHQDDAKKFNESASVNACTYKTTHEVGTLMNDGKSPILVVDTPGLSDGHGRDSSHMKDMTNYLKNEIRFVKLFVFTCNGEEPRFDHTTNKLLDTFEKNFGPEFWSHTIICYTRWSEDEEDQAKRRRADITAEKRRQ